MRTEHIASLAARGGSAPTPGLFAIITTKSSHRADLERQ